MILVQLFVQFLILRILLLKFLHFSNKFDILCVKSEDALIVVNFVRVMQMQNK
jgi:hypothetical protein